MLKHLKENLKKFYNLKKTYYRFCFSDKSFIKKYYRKHVGEEVDLENPKDFGEKLQWLKLNWYSEYAQICADKYKVRKIVQDKLGDKYLNELYAVYESVDEIDINELPKSFILKATHSSGQNFVCKDKGLVNWDEKFKEMKKWFDTNYFWNTREWVYKDIKPRIICEKFLSEGKNSTSLTDYKFYCFNGDPMYCQVIKDRSEKGGTIDFFDKEWKHMEFSGLQRMPPSLSPIDKPEKYNEMLEAAEKLAKGFPFVRVDFYYVNQQIFFGELTFFPKSGFGTFTPPEWNKKIGDLLHLPFK